MADISKITIGSTTYDIKDSVARASSGGTASVITTNGTNSSVTLASGTITTIPVSTSGTKYVQVGSDFSIASNGVKCNFDGAVIASGSAYVAGNTSQTAKGAYIYKGSEEMSGCLYPVNRSTAAGVAVAPIAFTVSNGDIITLRGRSTGVASTASAVASWITVQRVS